MRKAARKKVLLRGTIIVQQETFKGPRMMRLPCIIKDISVTGAKIDTLTVQAIPKEFVLEITDHDLRVPAQTRWRRNTQMGIAFSIGSTGVEALAGEKLTNVA